MREPRRLTTLLDSTSCSVTRIALFLQHFIFYLQWISGYLYQTEIKRNSSLWQPYYFFCVVMPCSRYNFADVSGERASVFGVEKQAKREGTCEKENRYMSPERTDQSKEMDVLQEHRDEIYNECE
jgi:hypothetical protein